MTALFPGLAPPEPRRRAGPLDLLRRAGELLVAGDHGFRVGGQVVDWSAVQVLVAVLAQVDTEPGRRWLAQAPVPVRAALAAWEDAPTPPRLVDLETP